MKTYFASCPRNSEEWLLEELSSIGVRQAEKKNGGVQFKSEDKKAMEVLFKSRIASRLYQLLDVYPVNNEKDVYNKITGKWWHKVFDVNQTFKVSTLFDKDAAAFFNNSMHFSLIVKDGIVDQFRNAVKRRPNVDTKNPDISILIRVESRGKESGFNAKAFLDLTNVPLSDRGYRRGAHRAPLRENLAATLVHISKWNPGEECFVDMFCGSGTILIEAALVQLGLPPTYLKIKKAIRGRSTDFAFLNQKWFKENQELQTWVQSYFESVVSRCNEVKNSESENIFGGDLDISTAEENIRAAGLGSHIKLIKKDFRDLKIECSSPGMTIISNPPFGERLKGADLEGLYHDIGETLKENFKNSKAFILTSELDLRKQIFLKSTQKYPLYNGPLDCRLVRYDLYE